MADKYIRDLSVITAQLAAQDKVIIEKADGSGTKIMGFSDLVASITANILKNNGTTTTAGYALDARYGKTLTDSTFHGRATLSSTITVDELITLPPGAYQYNTAYSWLPAGASDKGTIISIQDSVSGEASYGTCMIVDITMKKWIRHHSAAAWHSSSLGWVSMNAPTLTSTVKSINNSDLTLNTWNNIESLTRESGYNHIYVVKVSGGATSGARYVLQVTGSLQSECILNGSNLSGLNVAIIKGDGSTGTVQFYPTAAITSALTLRVEHLFIPI